MCTSDLQQKGGAGAAEWSPVQPAEILHQRGRGLEVFPGESAHSCHQSHDEHQRRWRQRSGLGVALRLLQGAYSLGTVKKKKKRKWGMNFNQAWQPCSNKKSRFEIDMVWFPIQSKFSFRLWINASVMPLCKSGCVMITMWWSPVGAKRKENTLNFKTRSYFDWWWSLQKVWWCWLQMK